MVPVLISIALTLSPAQPGQTADAAAAAAAKPDPMQKRVCRSEVATGSFMREIMCYTKAEWRQIDTAKANPQGDTGLSNLQRTQPPPISR